MDGSCVGLTERCNNVHDCLHGEDEEQCAGICGGDKWMCRSGGCVTYDQVLRDNDVKILYILFIKGV